MMIVARNIYERANGLGGERFSLGSSNLLELCRVIILDSRAVGRIMREVA
jgi:hypothetical protein